MSTSSTVVQPKSTTAVGRVLAVLAVSLLALALPSAAIAATEQEPNDGIHQADGPAAAGTTYTGAISSSGEVDTFIVYVSGQGTLNISTTNTNDATNHCDIYTALRDGDGNGLNSISTDENTTSPLPYNTPGAGVYYITISDNGCPVNTYSFAVTGPAVGGPRPGPAQPTTNGHSGITTALGPLAGALYGGSIDASGEEDWFFFYTARAGTFDVATTNTNDATNHCDVYTALLDGGGQSLNSTSSDEDTIGHIRYTAARRAKFVLRISDNGCPVNTYQFRISPAGLLTATPPPASRPSVNTINGTSGNDRLTGTPGKDVINCGAGNDTVDGLGGNDVIRCGSGNDRIMGGSGNDRISGGSGKDRIAGNKGNDRLSGGRGNDRISGNEGNDLLSGDSGRDSLFGNGGRDRLSGGSGGDRLFGGSGRDRLIGGPGRDRTRQ